MGAPDRSLLAERAWEEGLEHLHRPGLAHWGAGAHSGTHPGSFVGGGSGNTLDVSGHHQLNQEHGGEHREERRQHHLDGDAEQSMVLRMPTSAGKTLVAQLAIVHTLITQPGSRCLYIAPYRALVNEVEEAFGNLFTDLGYAASSVLGTYEQDTIDELILLRDEVLVLTPEKADLVLRLSPEFLDGVRLVVLDEGHIVGEGSRGAKYELLVTRLRHRLPSSRFLAMSAVVPDETLRDFALWLGADPQRSATTDWRPTIQRYAKLEWSGEVGTLRYAPGDQAAAEAAFVHGIVRQHRFEFVNPDTNRINRRRFPESGNRAEVAAALAYQVVSSGSVLIFCGQRGYAEAVGKALEARIALAEGQHESVPDVFNVSETRSHTVALEWLGEDHLSTRLLRRGIGVHHGQLPEAVRTAIEDDMRDRRIQVVAATSTLAQGVNLPVRTVIFHTAARFDELSGTQNPISAREYWNIAGRAGRAGAETEGLVVHLVFGPRDERAFQYYLRRRSSVEPVDAQLFDLLDDLTRQRLSRDAVRTVLDSEILALLVEESTDGLGATTREMLNRSLFAVQARHRGYEPTILIDAIVDGMRSVAEEVQDPELRRVFSSTGLASVSCLAIRDHALQRSEQWAYLLQESSDRDRSELIDLLLDGLAGIEEMQPPSGYAGNYSSLLEKWLDAESMAQIARDLEIGDVEALAKFVESFCGYQLPWGIAGYIRIASAVCGVEASSPLIQHLPSMVKYGVPNRVAVWAMGTGIPSRELAVRIASAYLATSRSPSAADFSRWLGRFDPERLAADLNISGTLLEDTARAVIRSHRSDLLDRVEQGEPLLPREATIPVSSVAMDRGVVFDITEGTSLEISRDYESVVNRNSVRVSYRGVFIGYLPWELATMLAPEMDAGLGIVGIVRHAEFDVRTREIEIVLERI